MLNKYLFAVLAIVFFCINLNSMVVGAEAEGGVKQVSPLGVRAGGVDPYMPVYKDGENMVHNPGFEAGDSMWRCNASNGVVPWKLVEGVGRNGGACMEYTSEKNKSNDMLTMFPVLTEPGKQYTLSFYAKSDSPEAKLCVLGVTEKWGIFVRDTKRIFPIGNTNGKWVRFTVPFTANMGILQYWFGDPFGHLANRNTLHQKSGIKIYLDDVQLVAGKEAGEFNQPEVLCHTKTSAKKNVYFTGKPAPLEVILANTTNERLPIDAKIEIRDAFRNVLQTDSIKESMSPKSKKNHVIDLAKTKKTGVFSIHAQVTAKGKTYHYFGRAARLAAVDRKLPFRYMYNARPVPSLDEAKWRMKLGYGGSLGFTLETNIERLKQYETIGWKHIFSINDGAGSKPVKLFEQKMTELDWKKFFAWMDKRIERFPGMNNWYKSLNEPDCPHRTWTPEECANILKHMHQKIKAVSPKSILLSPEPVSTNARGLSWLDKFFAAGGDKHIDAFATHTYRARPEAPSLDNDIQSIKKMIAKYKIANKSIYFTEGEGGVHYTVPSIKISPLKGYATFRLGMFSYDIGPSENLNAAMMVRTLLVCLKNADWVRTYVTWGDDFEDGQPWSAIGATNYLLDKLGDAKFVCERNINECKSYIFKDRKNTPVGVMWCYSILVEKQQISNPEARISTLGHKLKICDMQGNEIKVNKDGKDLLLPLGSYPLYLYPDEGQSFSVDEMTRIMESAKVGDQGLQSLSFSSEIYSLTGINLKAKNLLSHNVNGNIKITVDKQKQTDRTLYFSQEQEQELDAAIAGVMGKLNTAKVKMDFKMDDGASFNKEIDCRWYGIGRCDSTDNWWKNVKPIVIDNKSAIVCNEQPWSGVNDLSLKTYLGYTTDDFRLHLEVRDNAVKFPSDEKNFWKSDSVQLYFDLYGDGQQKPGMSYDSNDMTFWVSKLNGKDMFVRDLAPEWQISFAKTGVVQNADVKINRRKAITVYDIVIPKKEIFPIDLKNGTTFNLAILVNDADKADTRKQALTFTKPGTEPHRHPEYWPRAVLVD